MIVAEGFGTAAPYVVVDDANAFGEFLQQAFGGEETVRSD